MTDPVAPADPPASPAVQFIDRYAAAFAEATRVFGSAERAEQWLFEPNRFLAGDAPVARLRTDEGAEQIRLFLGQIDYGIHV